jgi:hypothetical protein
MKLLSFGKRRNHKKQTLVDRMGVLICLLASNSSPDNAEGKEALS